MDFLAYKKLSVSEELGAKKHLVKDNDHMSILFNDKSFGDVF